MDTNITEPDQDAAGSYKHYGKFVAGDKGIMAKNGLWQRFLRMNFYLLAIAAMILTIVIGSLRSSRNIEKGGIITNSKTDTYKNPMYSVSNEYPLPLKYPGKKYTLPIEKASISSAATVPDERMAVTDKKLKNVEPPIVGATSNQKATPPKHSSHKFTFAFEPNDFPKLAGYKGIVWEFAGVKDGFNPHFIYDTVWDDIQINKVENNEYALQLKKGDKEQSFKIIPAAGEK